jgi:two-component system, NtrC family, response regulator AtoC
MKNIRVLVVDDDPNTLDLMQFQLSAAGYEVATAAGGADGLRLAAEQRFDVALTDLQLPDMNGIELVKRFKDASPETEIIMVTGYGSVSTAVEATKAGAFFFVEKPVDMDELAILISKAVERREQAEEIRQLRGKLSSRTSYYNIIGASKAMQTIYEVIESVAESDANILIVGESGTGKEMIANAIHYASHRARKPFVKINCSALPKELIESELFGHTKGAFTGATMDKQGLIARAEGGSLLLDEIGEMPMELQPKLLRMLQERVYYRVGSEKAQEADFRLIAATNRNPLDAIRDGQLREDLFYRINTIEVRVPPLRERTEDVQHLAAHFLNEYAQKYRRPVYDISPSAYARLLSHSWPGNVRELQNVIERAVLLCKGSTIQVGELPFEQPQPARAEAASPASVSSPGAAPPPAPEDLSFEQIGKLIVSKVPDPKSGLAPEDLFERVEGVIVSAALERTRGNKQAAANLLGVYRPRLYSMIRKHGLGPSSEAADRDKEDAAPSENSDDELEAQTHGAKA